jgi:uncharacterized protein (TIGR02246 family)
MKNVLCIAAGMGMILLVASPSWAQQAKGATADEQAQAARAKAMIEAFNKGDAKAVAAFWTPDGDYMDELGHLFKGRKAIEAYFQKMFGAAKGAKLVVHRSGFRFIRPDLAIGDGIFEVFPPDGGPATSARYTAVQVKQDGQWFMASVREAVATAPNNAEKLEDLAWLIGDWADEGQKGALARLSFSWAENNNFIVSHFLTTVKDVPVAGGTQWIAWDAAAKQVRSWAFDSGGAISESAWSKDGNRMMSKTTTTLRDGKRVSSTNIVTRIDADHITWQSTGRSVDGKPLPDTQAVKLMRAR